LRREAAAARESRLISGASHGDMRAAAGAARPTARPPSVQAMHSAGGGNVPSRGKAASRAERRAASSRGGGGRPSASPYDTRPLFSRLFWATLAAKWRAARAGPRGTTGRGAGSAPGDGRRAVARTVPRRLLARRCGANRLRRRRAAGRGGGWLRGDARRPPAPPTAARHSARRPRRVCRGTGSSTTWVFTHAARRAEQGVGPRRGRQRRAARAASHCAPPKR
jgi:hypothetical protein